MTAAPQSAAPQSAARADARRNRTTVLRAAIRAFAEQGLDVSLGEIARQAGVGAGTVYRHFPSKEILLEAVLVEHVDGLVAAARRWAERAAPTPAFFGFLVEVVERSAGRSYVCDAVTADVSWPRPVLAESVRRFHRALAGLLDAAQRAGGVRTDVVPEDVTVLTAGCATMRAAHRDRAGGTRLVQLTLEGLRSPTPVTKPQTFRHAITPRCEECATELDIHPTGRPPRYCGPTCRQRAHRRRRHPPPNPTP